LLPSNAVVFTGTSERIVGNTDIGRHRAAHSPNGASLGRNALIFRELLRQEPFRPEPFSGQSLVHILYFGVVRLHGRGLIAFKGYCQPDSRTTRRVL
jgi:hypothetical protein